jgi:hypothetical protein
LVFLEEFMRMLAKLAHNSSILQSATLASISFYRCRISQGRGSLRCDEICDIYVWVYNPTMWNISSHPCFYINRYLVFMLLESWFEISESLSSKLIWKPCETEFCGKGLTPFALFFGKFLRSKLEILIILSPYLWNTVAAVRDSERGRGRQNHLRGPINNHKRAENHERERIPPWW